MAGLFGDRSDSLLIFAHTGDPAFLLGASSQRSLSVVTREGLGPARIDRSVALPSRTWASSVCFVGLQRIGFNLLCLSIGL